MLSQAKTNKVNDKKLSCRKETVRLLYWSVLAKSNWKTIFRGHNLCVLEPLLALYHR